MMTNMAKLPEVRLDVRPKGHLLVDDELSIRILGLRKGQKVTIFSVLKEEKKIFESYCWFIADEHGAVDLQNHLSISGTYEGVSPMGIFWSMVPAPGQRKGIRIIKNNTDTPFRTSVYVYDDHVTPEFVNVSLLLCSDVIERWYITPDVTSHDVTDGRVRGRLFLPAGPGPFPGVISISGTVGGLKDYTASLLASRGFAALALAYFAYKDLGPGLGDVDLDYFLEAADWMVSHQKVCSEGVGVYGLSKGGEIGMLMASFCPKIRAVVSVNGCTFISSPPIQYSKRELPYAELLMDRAKFVDGYMIQKECLDYTTEHLIPVWKSDVKVLNFLSEDDMHGPKECIRLMKKHYPADKTDNFTIVSYPGAGHIIEPPYTSLSDLSYHRVFDICFNWGGKAKPHAHAQEDSWRKSLQFLRANIPIQKTDEFVSKL